MVAGPKMEADARERVKVGTKKFSKPLAELLAKDANEGEIRLLVTDFLLEDGSSPRDCQHFRRRH